MSAPTDDGNPRYQPGDAVGVLNSFYIHRAARSEFSGRWLYQLNDDRGCWYFEDELVMILAVVL